MQYVRNTYEKKLVSLVVLLQGPWLVDFGNKIQHLPNNELDQGQL